MGKSYVHQASLKGSMFTGSVTGHGGSRFTRQVNVGALGLGGSSRRKAASPKGGQKVEKKAACPQGGGRFRGQGDVGGSRFRR
jgi:hypothetical protein